MTSDSFKFPKYYETATFVIKYAKIGNEAYQRGETVPQTTEYYLY